MATRAALALVLSAFVVQSAPPPLPSAAPSSVGVDAGKLQEAVQLYRDAVKRDDIRGVVLYVARRGKVILHEAIGWAHHAYQVPMKKDTLFRMASNTKPVVAAGVVKLAEDGALAFSDPVAKYLRAFDNEKSRRITIDQLLTHSSGFRIQPIFYPFGADDERTLQAAVAKFGAEGPAAEAGTYSYSNPGYNTLAAVIEVVSKKSLEDYLKSAIYDPLGMSDTLNHEDPTKLARMATVYRGRGGRAGGPVVFTQGFVPGDPPDFPVIRGSGGLISTAADYARFLEMYRLGGAYAGKRILTESSVKAAITPRVKSGGDQSYGYGWMIRPDGSYSHSGSDGTLAWVDPSRELIAMILTQSPGGRNPNAEFRKLIEASITK